VATEFELVTEVTCSIPVEATETAAEDDDNTGVDVAVEAVSPSSTAATTSVA
jgi:hypothetical protein